MLGSAGSQEPCSAVAAGGENPLCLPFPQRWRCGVIPLARFLSPLKCFLQIPSALLFFPYSDHVASSTNKRPFLQQQMGPMAPLLGNHCPLENCPPSFGSSLDAQLGLCEKRFRDCYTPTRDSTSQNGKLLYYPRW